jgi:hypothetical protein
MKHQIAERIIFRSSTTLRRTFVSFPAAILMFGTPEMRDKLALSAERFGTKTALIAAIRIARKVRSGGSEYSVPVDILLVSVATVAENVVNVIEIKIRWAGTRFEVLDQGGFADEATVASWMGALDVLRLMNRRPLML